MCKKNKKNVLTSFLHPSVSLPFPFQVPVLNTSIFFLSLTLPPVFKLCRIVLIFAPIYIYFTSFSSFYFYLNLLLLLCHTLSLCPPPPSFSLSLSLSHTYYSFSLVHLRLPLSGVWVNSVALLSFITSMSYGSG